MRFVRSLISRGLWRVLLAAASGAEGSEHGHPEVRVLPALTPSSERLYPTIGQLPDGRMIFATPAELWLHDGRFNEAIPLPVRTDVHQAKGQPDGSILVAASHVMAIARPKTEGGWAWETLRAAPPDAPANVPRVPRRVWPVGYQLHVLPEGLAAVGYRDQGGVFAGWRSRDGRWSTWEEGEQDRIIRYLDTGKAFHRLQDGRLLQRWAGGRWQPDRTLSGPIAPDIVELSDRGDGRLRVVERTPAVRTIESDGTVRSWSRPTAAEAPVAVLLSRSLPDGGMVWVDVLSTIRFLKPDGSLAAKVDATSGLPLGGVTNVFVEQAGSVWATVEGHIVRIDHPFHLTRFDRFNGLSSPAVHALVRHDGRLYAGTEAGIYRLDPGAQPGAAQFQLLPGPKSRSSSFLLHDGQLLAGSIEGVFAMRGQSFERLPDSPTRVTSLAPSVVDSDIVYAATHVGVRRLQSGPAGWSTLDPAGPTWAQSFLEAGRDDWWVVNGVGLAQRHYPAPPQPPLSPPGSANRPPMLIFSYMFGRRVVADILPGVADHRAHGRTFSLHRWGGTPVAAGASGLVELAGPASSAGLLDAATREALADRYDLAVFSPTSPDRAWIALRPRAGAGRDGLGWQLRETARGAGQPLRILPSDIAAAGAIHALLAEEAVLWIGGEEGLRRVELAGLSAPAPPAAPLLRPTGALARQPHGAVLPPGHDAVGFEFSTTDYRSGAATAFRTRVVSLGRGEWSAFSLQPARDLGQLPAGRHRFEVQARNADGLTGPVSHFEYLVARPWWFSWWAGTIVAGAAGGLLAAGMRWSSRRSRARERRLAALVEERTATLRASEQQLSAAKTQAERANHAKSIFLAAMSHELRTPLNAILGFAQILRREDGLSDKGHGQLEVIDRNGQHLLHMINEVLDLSKIEAEEMPLQTGVCSLRSLAAELAAMFELRMSEKALAFRLEYGAGVPPVVMADEPKLRQVLINLLANAVKFTAAGEVVLALTRHGERIRFEVRDTGPGIAAAELETVFEPFRQARLTVPRPAMPPDRARQGEASGTGLGLPISQRLVGLMGGRIAVESHVGRGSRFRFDLALPAAASGSPFPPPARRIVGYEGPRRRVLIVDDVATNRAVLSDLLALLGFDLSQAATGEEALAAHARQPADLVLLDLHLPDIAGAEVARRLRAGSHPPRLIAVSASVFDFNSDPAGRTGCDAFVPKPIDETNLLAAMAAQLQLRWTTMPIAGNRAAAAEAATARSTTDMLALALPPAAVLERWLDLARRADLGALDEQLDVARAAGPDLEFRRGLHELVQGFRTGAIRKILTAALARQASTRPSP